MKNIETLRVLATFLLVSYHAIGSHAEDAMRIDYPHIFRFFVDILVDVRMPLFAFISGWVYAQKPVVKGQSTVFTTGKIRRLLLPGIIAATIFWVAAKTLSYESITNEYNLLNVLTLSFVHFWFLQAIFIILIVFFLIENTLGHELQTFLIFLLIIVFSILPAPHNHYIETSSLVYLTPYFLFGVCFARNSLFLIRFKQKLVVLSALIIITSLYLNLREYLSNGTLDLQRRDLQSYMMASGSIMFLSLTMPNLKWLASFGAVSFTIYLYHVFGTAGARKVVDIAGIQDLWSSVPFVIFCGIVLPILFHLICAKFKWSRLIFLGMRDRT